MILNHIILATLWMIYCVLHSVLASEWLKKKLRQKMKDYKWYRLWYTLFAFVFLALIIYYQIKISAIELFKSNNLIFIAGITISSTGLILMLVCIRKYFMSLSGLRSLIIENFSNELQVTGIHKYVRHPLYLGTFMFIWGLFLLLPFLSLFVANVIITIYTLIGIELEEQKLITEFGESYRQYQKTVPKLIPSLKFKR
jgi:protein-S-isoprenylcysteine O-methyltransferase Ste14